MPADEQFGAVAREGVHQLRHRANAAGRQQKVHVIAHQHLGAQSAAEPRSAPVDPALAHRAK
jgi:hypothetical protein